MNAIKRPMTMGKYCRATKISSEEVYYQVVILNPQEIPHMKNLYPKVS